MVGSSAAENSLKEGDRIWRPFKNRSHRRTGEQGWNVFLLPSRFGQDPTDGGCLDPIASQDGQVPNVLPHVIDQLAEAPLTPEANDDAGVVGCQAEHVERCIGRAQFSRVLPAGNLAESSSEPDLESEILRRRLTGSPGIFLSPLVLEIWLLKERSQHVLRVGWRLCPESDGRVGNLQLLP